LRKGLFAILIIAAALLVLPALAEQVTLPSIPAVLTLPEGVYSPVITVENLAANEAFITARGETLAQWQEDFKSGVALKAFDIPNDRVLVVSAVLDADGQSYVDIDQQTPTTRASYRRLHLDKQGPYAAQGYRYESAEWKNFSHVGRFLMLKYSVRTGGSVAYRGYARRSVKNGMTITVDMQVHGRGIKGADNNALNQVFDTLSFTGAAPEGRTLPTFLNETQTAPTETNQPSFVMKGTTRAGATLKAVLMSFTSENPRNFTAIADPKGNYSMEVTIPSEGIYLMTLSVEAEGLEPLERQYSITYGRSLLPVTFTSELPEVLTENSYKIAGTTESGVTVQMIFNGKNTTRRTNNAKTFSFNINTKEPGEYDIKLSFSKNGYSIREFTYHGTKGTAAPAAIAAAPAGTPSPGLEALSPTYTDLIAQADAYDSKLLTYDGYVTKVEQEAGDWVISLALRKAVTGYADTVLVVADHDPGMALQSRVRVYGTLIGLNSNEEGSLSYPRLQMQSIQQLPEQEEEPGQAA
jgi:hypothetical protein